MKKIDVIIHHELALYDDMFAAVYDYGVPFLMTVKDDEKYHVGDRVKVMPKEVQDKKEKCLYMKITCVIRGEKYGVQFGYLMLGLTKINL